MAKVAITEVAREADCGVVVRHTTNAVNRLPGAVLAGVNLMYQTYEVHRFWGPAPAGRWNPGGIVVPFPGIWAIDQLLVLFHLA